MTARLYSEGSRPRYRVRWREMTEAIRPKEDPAKFKIMARKSPYVYHFVMTPGLQSASEARIRALGPLTTFGE